MEVLSKGWLKGLVDHKIVFIYNHDPTICAKDKNCTVLDVKCHEECDRQALLLVEKDRF